MKNFPTGDGPALLKTLPKWAVFGGCGLFLLMLPFSIPNLREKNKAELQNHTVSVVLSWDDLQTFSFRENKDITLLLSDLNNYPIYGVTADLSLTSAQEKLIRENRWKLIWISSKMNLLLFEQLSQRFQAGDGIISSDDYAPGYPTLMKEVGKMIVQKNGFFPLIEIMKSKGAATVARMSGVMVVKTHILPVEEMWAPNISLWTQRLVRSVRERSVRLLVVHFSPALSLDANLKFLRQFQSTLESFHFEWGTPQAYSWRQLPFQNFGRWSAFLLACFAPVVVLLLIWKGRTYSTAVLFTAVTFFSLCAGIVIHGLGATPNFVLGIDAMRGVKLQLVIPLGLSFMLLVDRSEWQKWIRTPLTGFHVLVFGGLGGLLLILYVMRSGNFPLLPVSQHERSIRDCLEIWLGVRPRFKEFFIGHPLLLWAIVKLKKNPTQQDFVSDGRLILLLGLIGQISIINTFTHFHTPLFFGVLRTFHGWWLGLLCGWMMIRIAKKLE